MISNPPSTIRNPRLPRAPRAFTLVELLVVITIIGILIALLLPAVQAAREAARQVQCKNHLKQLALGCLNHEYVHEFFPTGGWGDAWMADPDQGFTKEQPGGWLFTVLPYIEQQSLFEMGATGSHNQWPVPATKKAMMDHRNQTLVSAFYCPTRRKPLVTPNTRGWFYNANNPPTLNRADYAMNAGGVYDLDVPNLPPGYNGYVNTTYPTANDSLWPPTGGYDGIGAPRSMVKVVDITDGLSNTYLVGEKYLNPDAYYGAVIDDGDDEGAFAGFNGDQYRFTCYKPANLSWSAFFQPMQDTPGYAITLAFGSAHANGFHVTMCDGSVQMINYTIDRQIHRQLGSRRDGMIIDGKKF